MKTIMELRLEKVYLFVGIIAFVLIAFFQKKIPDPCRFFSAGYFLLYFIAATASLFCQLILRWRWKTFLKLHWIFLLTAVWLILLGGFFLPSILEISGDLSYAAGGFVAALLVAAGWEPVLEGELLKASSKNSSN
ncbi:MAG: hypothetical protein LBI35_04870 [Burkholderiales bacterium]|nr:hypothetical protein [Burkholderiales bacterium]